MPKNKIALFIFLLFLTTYAGAQQLINDKVDIIAGEKVFNQNAVIYLPPNYSTAKKYPLIISTHGMAQAGNNINLLYNDGLPYVLKNGYQPPFDFIMIAPQRGSYSIDPNWLPGILEDAQKRFPIDSSRIYLTGYDAGGWTVYGSQLNADAGLAEKFAAIVICSGATQDANKANLNRWETTRTPLWAIVGNIDVSYRDQNKYMVDEINKRASGAAILTVRPDVSHGGWNDIYRGDIKTGSLNMWQWLYQFKRVNGAIVTGNDIPPATDDTTPTTNTDTNSSTPPVASTTTAKAVPGKIEAEDFDDMSGVKNENTLDAGGGQNVGYIDDGEWMDYKINVATAGNYTVSFRVAVPKDGQLQLKKQDGTLLATVNLNTTGGWQVYNTVSTTVNLPAGVQTLRVYISKGGWNFNWFAFAEGNNDSNPPAPTPPFGGDSDNTNTGTVSNGGFANYTLTTKDGDIWRPNGLGIAGLKPGDTLNIMAGNYNLVELGNFKGDAAHPIIIRNKGGLVTIKEVRLSHNAQYFKFLGNGYPGLTYGIKIVGTQGTGLSAFASDFEVGYVEVTGSGAGLYIKKNPEAGNTITQYPNYVMKNIYIHHNYIHNTTNEGMYIGHTYPNGDPYDQGMIPIRLSNVEIAYNTVSNTAWDGIQLSNATDDCQIHDNTVTNFGTANASGQQAGIIMGANTTGQVYNNTVKSGTGNGIEIFGYGTIKLYNNTVENTGYDGTSYGQESIFCNDPKSTVESRPEQQMNIYNNIVLNPKPKAAIRVSGYENNSLPATIQNNKVRIANAPDNWEKLYIFSVKGSNVTGNTLY